MPYTMMFQHQGGSSWPLKKLRKNKNKDEYCMCNGQLRLDSIIMVAGGSTPPFVQVLVGCCMLASDLMIMLCDPGRGSCNFIVLPCVVCCMHHGRARHLGGGGGSGAVPTVGPMSSNTVHCIASVLGWQLAPPHRGPSCSLSPPAAELCQLLRLCPQTLVQA